MGKILDQVHTHKSQALEMDYKGPQEPPPPN